MLKGIMTTALIIVVVFALGWFITSNTDFQTRTETSSTKLQEVVSTELSANFNFIAREEVGKTMLNKETFEQNLINRIKEEIPSMIIDGEAPKISVTYAEIADPDGSGNYVVGVMVEVEDALNNYYTASYEFDVLD